MAAPPTGSFGTPKMLAGMRFSQFGKIGNVSDNVGAQWSPRVALSRSPDGEAASYVVLTFEQINTSMCSRTY